MNKKYYILVLCIALITNWLYAAEFNPAFRRITLAIGSNNGGAGREELYYAGTDAKAVVKVLQELGGVSHHDSHLLINPGIYQIKKIFRTIRNNFTEVPGSQLRTEFIFYYSGHSDEQGLLLGNERLSYKMLKNLITGIGADVNIAILDSCSSGVFTRLKGGTHRAPFLVDESVTTSGYAFLTSSSADEASQESDALKASFFTHFFISALRGAGDSTQDGKVTLNEAFSFASEETLASTSQTQGGVQHPAYNIDLTGSGDLVLTDLRITDSGIMFGSELRGRIFIKDETGRVVTELYKNKGEPVTIALPLGNYTISLVDNKILSEAHVYLDSSKKRFILSGNFRYVPSDATRARGNAKRRNDPLIDIWNEVGILADMRILGSNRVLHNYSISLIGNGYRLSGTQVGLINFITEDVEGIQISPIFNIIDGTNRGAQLAGIFNMSNGSTTFQGAGIFNISNADTKGAQTAGIFNISAGSLNGFQGAGIFNMTEDRAKGIQLAGILNISKDFFDGMQGSGILNFSEGSKGFQMSLVNITGDMSGFQFGLVNYGHNVHGVQLGLVNINNEIKGLPIGLINISRKGLSHLSVWQDSTGFAYASLQMGARSLYTRIFGGESTKSESSELITGIGAGYHLGLGPLYFESEVSLRQFTGSLMDAVTPSAPRKTFTGINLEIGIEFFKSIALFGGIAWNGEIVGITDPVPTLLQTQTSFTEAVFNTGYTMKLYQKWFLGLRL